ncbi:MAG: YkgJ family cysteine cluster protein [Sulfuricella denitrificans]|nr:YkgJ family cysteine cluster protein [Sulfuricella denitrificans]
MAKAGHTPISCASCEACCCRLEVLLMAGDDIPFRLTAENPWGGQVMARMEDGWCAALDRNTMLCRIYALRPSICRDYQEGDSDCIGQRARLMPHRIVAAGKVV